MRIRAMIAALAVACSLALCAVPAFADTDIVVYESEYGTVTVRTWSGNSIPDGIASGIYRTAEGLQLVSLVPNATVYSSDLYWSYSVDNATWTSTDISSLSSSIYVEDLGYYRREVRDVDNHVVSITFQVTSIGEDLGNDTVGVFGMVTQTIGSVTEWASSWIDAILDEPVLMFFVLALALLTIGITVVKRLLSVRA